MSKTKILAFQIKNFKNLSSVSKRVKSDIIYVLGKNGSGKSSIVQAIFSALNKKNIPPQPVMKGKKNATLQVQLGDNDIIEYDVTRTVNPDGTSEVVVKTADNRAISKPDNFLNKIMGASVYNITDYLRMRPEDQAKKFKEMFNIDTSELDSKRTSDYNQRTQLNRDIKKLDAIMGESSYKPSDLEIYKEKKSIEDLNEEILAASNLRNEKSNLYREIEYKTQDKGRVEKSIEDGKKQREDWEKEIEAIKKKITESIVTGKQIGRAHV